MEDPIKILERNVQAILNKLTPQNFDKLVAEFKVLKIDTVPKLEACVELIFEKAVDEHEFSQSYARMCEVLSGKKVTNESSGQKHMNFQRMMITRCQKEFERDYMEGFDKEKYKAALAAEESEDKRKTMQLEYEEKERRARHRSLGNIRFIGELYNLKMLTYRIMHEIIRRLVTQTDEESLECLCWLLNTIGKQLDQYTESKIFAGDKTLMSFDHYFGKMEGLVKDKKVPARVRFLIQDVIDLRKSNWIPRREKAGPKTLDQIHKEVEKEKLIQDLIDLRKSNWIPRREKAGPKTLDQKEQILRLQTENKRLKDEKRSEDPVLQTMVDDLKDRETRLESTNRSLHQKILELESKLEESKGTVPHVAGSREELELKLSEANEKINQLSETVHKKEIELQGMIERYKKYIEKAKSVIKILDSQLNEKDRLLETLEKLVPKP